MNLYQLIGLNEEHLTFCHSLKTKIHKEAETPLLQLKEEAAKEGFDLQVLSSYRGFDAQLKIWNAKALGERKLLSDSGETLDYNSLSKEEVMWRILRWSALPGFSRHHWGTDLDIYDQNAIKDSDYNVQLTPQEVAPDGVFGPFHLWLSEKIQKNESFQFFRPYQKDQGGVAPEMWHLSYFPVSQKAREDLSFETFQDFLRGEEAASIELLDLVNDNRERIFQQFVLNITPPQWP